MHDGTVNCGTGADVLADHTDLSGDATAWYFFAGEQIDQLLLATRRILSGYHGNFNAAALCCSAHRFDRLWLIIFNANDGFFAVNNALKNFNAADNFCRPFTHQHVVGSDVGLALCGINNELINAVLWFGTELYGCRKTGATHAGNTCFAQSCYQCTGWAAVAPVGQGV